MAGCRCCEHMKKYIDADKIHDIIAMHVALNYISDNEEIVEELRSVWNELKAIPGEDVAEVRRGRWRLLSRNMNAMTEDYECTACLGILMDVAIDDNENHTLPKYCSMCGALMEDA